MNALVPTYHSQLPAFLRDPSLFAETDKAIAGIGGGMPCLSSSAFSAAKASRHLMRRSAAAMSARRWTCRGIWGRWPSGCPLIVG